MGGNDTQQPGNGDDRFTFGLIIDVFDALEKHGYHRVDDQHTGRAVGLLARLVKVYEGRDDDGPAGR